MHGEAALLRAVEMRQAAIHRQKRPKPVRHHVTAEERLKGNSTAQLCTFAFLAQYRASAEASNGFTGTKVAVPCSNAGGGQNMVMVWRWCRDNRRLSRVRLLRVSRGQRGRHLVVSDFLVSSSEYWCRETTAPDVTSKAWTRKKRQSRWSWNTSFASAIDEAKNSQRPLPSHTHGQTSRRKNVRTHTCPRKPPRQRQGQGRQARRLHRPNRMEGERGSTDMRVHLGTRMTVAVREGSGRLSERSRGFSESRARSRRVVFLSPRRVCRPGLCATRLHRSLIGARRVALPRTCI
ncbi:hypothetical protein IWX90DRAFT_66272 [Phyllosticta citrichinensis]|uniref:Ig-like domain-containing protein n=1 Tax=Phyllosticta citrichinensis TaxID=1130410 RepID=A0ABR1XHJ3_9PEZI